MGYSQVLRIVVRFSPMKEIIVKLGRNTWALMKQSPSQEVISPLSLIFYAYLVFAGSLNFLNRPIIILWVMTSTRRPDFAEDSQIPIVDWTTWEPTSILFQHLHLFEVSISMSSPFERGLHHSISTRSRSQCGLHLNEIPILMRSQSRCVLHLNVRLHL